MSRARKRVWRLRLRATGKVFVVISMLVLLAAWNTGANLLYIVLGGLGSFLIASFVLCLWSVRGTRVTRQGPDAVHRLDKFGVSVRIENRKFVMPATSVRIERVDEPYETAAYAVRIPARRAAYVRMTESFARRGVQPLPAIALASGFPFGLVERCKAVRDGHEVIVYPRVITVRPGILEQLPGSCTVPKVVRGDGDEFFSLREYIPGDDVRRVAWRASARRGTLLVREMAVETSRFIVFAIDTALRAHVQDFEERFEETIELAASLAVTLLNQQYTVSIVTATDSLTEGEGQTQTRKVLEFLARVVPNEDPSAQGFGWFAPGEEFGRASYAFLSPDPADWGQRSPLGGSKILDPREAVRA